MSRPSDPRDPHDANPAGDRDDPRDPDEVASDVVDGLLAPDEEARARQDPEVAARVDTLDRVRSAIRDVTPPDDLARARAVAAAVGAGSDTGPGPDQVPRTYGPPRRGRRRAPTWLAAAAGVTVLVLAAGLIARQGDDSDEMTASDAPETRTDAPGDAGGSEATEESADRAAPESGAGQDGGAAPEPDDAAGGNAGTDSDRSTTTTGQIPHLGDVTGPAELVDRVGAARSGAAPAPSSESGGGGEGGTGGRPTGCPARTPGGDPQRGRSTFVATAVLDGEVVWVHVYAPETVSRLVATAPDCADVLDRPLGES